METSIGFTDEEIHRLKQGLVSCGPVPERSGSPGSRSKFVTTGGGRRKAVVNPRRVSPPDHGQLSSKCPTEAQQAGETCLPQADAPSTAVSLSTVLEKAVASTGSDSSLLTSDTTSTKPSTTSAVCSLTTAAVSQIPPSEDRPPVDELVGVPLFLLSLQEQQRQLELENRTKRSLLSKTINDRFSKTCHEAQLLRGYQEELKKMDSDLASGIESLRHQIELETVSYSDNLKSFTKLEREYIDARLKLKLNKERKDMLTENLYLALQDIERRKAAKLAEVLVRLGTGAEGGDNAGPHSPS